MQGTLTFTQRINEYPILYTGIVSSDIGQCPTSVTTTDLLTQGNVKVEAITSGLIGAYVFDFSRMISLAGQLISNFAKVRIHGGSMSVMRVDTGANWGLTQDVSRAMVPVVSPGFPTNFGTRPTIVKVHYIRLSHGESLTSDWDVYKFMQDRRRRVVNLRIGRKLTFRFHPMSYMRSHYTTVTRARNTAAPPAPPEIGMTRDMAMPVHPRRMGWIDVLSLFPSGLPTKTYVDPNSVIAARPGLPPNVQRLLSGTVLILFDWLGAGPFSVALAPHGDPPAISDDVIYTPAALPLIRRSEWCRYTMHGINLTMKSQVGQVVQVQVLSQPPNNYEAFSEVYNPLYYTEAARVPHNPYAAVNTEVNHEFLCRTQGVLPAVEPGNVPPAVPD